MTIWRGVGTTRRKGVVNFKENYPKRGCTKKQTETKNKKKGKVSKKKRRKRAKRRGGELGQRGSYAPQKRTGGYSKGESLCQKEEV